MYYLVNTRSHGTIPMAEYKRANQDYLNSLFGAGNLQRLQARNSFSQLYPEE